MRALIAFDKFKDALTARETCQIAADTLRDCHPDWEIETAPLADGGDGFCDTLTGCLGGTFHEAAVTGPLGETVTARFGIVYTNKVPKPAREILNWKSNVQRTAIIELAESSGISLTPLRDRSPWIATTAGLGEVLLYAVQRGAEGAIIGLGGSATHDLALGALQKLGYQFFSSSGKAIADFPTPDIWPRIEHINAPANSLPEEFALHVACDVENPLLGPQGAAAVFGPQKGLDAARYEELESATRRMARMLSDTLSVSYSTMEVPGAGAAGGAAFGLQVGLGAQIVPGYELVKNWIGLDAKFERADIILTGEGRFDASSLQGKGPGALALEATERQKKLMVLSGSLGEIDSATLPDDSIRAISPPDMPLEEAIRATRQNLEKAIRSAFGA